MTVGVAVFCLLTSALPAFASAEPVGSTFTDTSGSVHRAEIEAIARQDITRGCNPPTNDRFCPDDVVTRGQMAAFLDRVSDLPVSATDFFSDDDGSVFEAEINRIADANITRGCNPPVNDRFCPDDIVTRGQMAAFLVRAFSFPSPSPRVNAFNDDNGSVFEGDIEALAAAGVTRGCNPPDNDRFCPGDPVTREQMASFLVRAIDGLDPFVPADPADWYLHEAGVGDVLFDSPTEPALLEFAILGDPAVEGDPDEDTGWIDSFSVYGTCPGSHIRMVRWGNLQTFFTRDSLVDPGRFFTFKAVANPAYTDMRLRTEDGLQAGDTVAELGSIYGSRLEIVLVDPFNLWIFWVDAGPGDAFDELGGSITGSSDTDTVGTIEAGLRCGE